MFFFRQTNKKTIYPLLIIAGLAVFIFLSVLPVPAFGVSSAKTGLDQAAGQGFFNDHTKTIDENTPGILVNIPKAIGKILGMALSFLGVVFLILMIYGGLTWMTARGNEADVTKAKDLLTAAVIGLVIVLAAYAITSYVGTTIAG